MLSVARSASEAVERLKRCDFTLKHLNLADSHHKNSELDELADCLLAHPDVIISVHMGGNQLTDETGVKLARWLATSATVDSLNLTDNKLGEATYLALAAALQVNSSLQNLDLYGNQAVDQTRVDAAFVEALRLNPARPAFSMWLLYSFAFGDVDLQRLRDAAEQLGHPTLQLLLTQLC